MRDAPQRVPVFFDRERVLADEERRDALQPGQHAARADSGDTLIGLDLDDRHILVAFRKRPPRRMEGVLFVLEDESAGTELGDLQRRLRRRASSLPRRLNLDDSARAGRLIRALMPPR